MKSDNSAFQALHPTALTVFFAVQITLTMFISHPLMLAISLVGGWCFCAVLDGIKKFFSDLAFYLPMMVITAAVNPLFSHNGVTPLFFMNGNAVTLEAVLCGCNISLMLGAVVYWCKCMSAVMSSDRLMYIFGRAVPALSLVLSMALRLIPLLRRRFSEIKSAQASLGLYDRNGKISHLRADLKVFSALLGWTLENAVLTSDSMKARGYGLKGRSSYSVFRFTVYDGVFLSVLLLCVVPIIGGIAVGTVDFDFYPRISTVGFEPFCVLIYVLFAFISFLPFVCELREVLRWKYSLSKI